MKNKIFFSFMLCTFSFLIASEKMKDLVLNSCITGIQMQVSVNKGQEDWYDVLDLYGRNIQDSFTGLIKESTVLITKQEYSGSMLAIQGKDTSKANNFRMIIDDENNLNKLKEILSESAHLYPNNNDLPNIYLLKKDREKEIEFIFLQLTKDQVKGILGEKSYSSGQTIKIVGFGIAGLIALVYYFDLYAKGMALLGRG